MWDKHGLSDFMINQAKDHFLSWQVSVTSTGVTQVSDAIELLLTKYTMPKTSSNDRINAAFEEIAEALNNSKLREGFLNGNKENEILNELVEIFDRKRKAKPIVKSSYNSTPHVCARVNHTSCAETNTHGPARVSHNPSTQKNPVCPCKGESKCNPKN